MFRRRYLLPKLVVLALVAVPVAAAAAHRGGSTDSLSVSWDAARPAAALRGTFAPPASVAGTHVVLDGQLQGDLGLARRLHVVVRRHSDGALLYEGSLADLAGFDLGTLPQAPSGREFGYVVTLPGGGLAAGSLKASFRWTTRSS